MDKYLEALSKTPEAKKRMLVKRRFMEVRKKLRATIRKRNLSLKAKMKNNSEKLKKAIVKNKKQEIDTLAKID